MEGLPEGSGCGSGCGSGAGGPKAFCCLSLSRSPSCLRSGSSLVGGYAGLESPSQRGSEEGVLCFKCVLKCSHGAGTFYNGYVTDKSLTLPVQVMCKSYHPESLMLTCLSASNLNCIWAAPGQSSGALEAEVEHLAAS